MNGVNSWLYNLPLVVHVLAVVAAFGPTLGYRTLVRLGADSHSSNSAAARTHSREVIPALVVSLIAGTALVGISDGAWDFSQGWISGAFTVVLLLLAVSIALVGALRSASANERARKRASMLTGMFHLGLVIAVVLMVWKPGA